MTGSSGMTVPILRLEARTEGAWGGDRCRVNDHYMSRSPDLRRDSPPPVNGWLFDLDVCDCGHFRFQHMTNWIADAYYNSVGLRLCEAELDAMSLEEMEEGGTNLCVDFYLRWDFAS